MKVMTALTPEQQVQEAIRLVKDWVADDLQYDESERMTSETMVDNLYHDKTLPDLSEDEIKRVVAKHAPNAPRKQAEVPQAAPAIVAQKKLPPYPAELKPLIESGVAYSEDGVWLLERCRVCGKLTVDAATTISKPEWRYASTEAH